MISLDRGRHTPPHPLNSLSSHRTMSSALQQQNKKLQKKTWGPDSGGRQKNVQIVKRFLIGCRSKRLDNSIPNLDTNGAVDLSVSTGNSGSAPVVGKIPTVPTHHWSLYLRSFDNEDLGVWIKKVQYKLHDSFPDYLRTVTEHPFSLSEIGWGDFEVQVKVFFQDSNERQVNLYTWVRLSMKEGDRSQYYDHDGYLVSQFLDEFVFSEPTAMMVDLLNTRKPDPSYSYPKLDYYHLQRETDERIRLGRKRVLKEIETIKAQYKEYEAISVALAARLALPGSLGKPDRADDAMENAADQNIENLLTDL